jgi:hypothetical protein
MRLVVVGGDEFEDGHDGLAVGFGFGVTRTVPLSSLVHLGSRVDHDI